MKEAYVTRRLPLRRRGRGQGQSFKLNAVVVRIQLQVPQSKLWSQALQGVLP